MSVKVEDLGKNMMKLGFEVSYEEFEAACERAYQKNKGRINVQGFRKGKAPRKMIERIYGKGIFYEDAINDVLPNAYEKAVEESGLDVVAQPDIDIDGEITTNEPIHFVATVAVKPEVTLGQYKGIEVEKAVAEVSDAEINAELENDRKKNARQITVEDRAVEDGDTVNINYKGTVDGVAFDGGTAEDYDLKIGSHSFIDTFEDQIIGHNLGDEFDVNVTFPEQYHAEELAGKPAVFAVKINKITAEELPELDDEFASEVSEYDTLDEYKVSVRERILNRKQETLKTEKENKVVDAVIENAQMEIPDAMVLSTCRQMADEFAQQLQYQGMNLEQYMSWTGMDSQKFLDSLKPQATKRIQTRLVLEAIAKAENLDVTEEEINAEYQKMADQYGMDVETIKSYLSGSDEQMKEDLAVQKAIDLIVAEAVETEPAKAEEE
ncbi:MAG: trigger factor [Lachnospiraceae bacterium]|nr:trigger factor [Lachnospiraceae bacterium]